MAYRILSFDGGGVRGVYSATLLARLVEQVPSLVEQADFLAGTSTGGIIALGLASGLEPSALVSLYRDNASKIFNRSLIREVERLTHADYSNQPLHDALFNVFGNMRMARLRKPVIIPSFDVNIGQPRMFVRGSDGDELVLSVAMRTSAAPTYFPSYGQYIDGGVVANDPSMVALCQALWLGLALGDLRLFSVGAGSNPATIAGKDLDWGIAQWAKPLVNLIIDDAVAGAIDFECHELLGERYFRLQSALPKPIALDDAHQVANLVEYANQVDIQPAADWLAINWSRQNLHPDLIAERGRSEH